MRVDAEDYSRFVQSARVSSTPTTTARPSSYINPERLMDDLAKLYASRDRVMISLTALDCAALAAGTPIRSTSARERFMDLSMRLRDIDAIARKAWQDEVAAAGGYNPKLRPILVKAGECDARGLKTLLSKDGKHIDATEYEELLSVLEGAIVKAREAGIEEYAASLFANLDPNTLKLLVDDAPKFSYTNADDKALIQRLGDVLAELRDLFAVVVQAPDLATRFPKFWARTKTMETTTLLALLQTGRGSPIDGPLLKGVNSDLLVRIADRVFVSEPSWGPGRHALPDVWTKPLTLRLLREDQLNGGKAFSLFLSSPTFSDAGFVTVSQRLDALLATSSIAASGAIQLTTTEENTRRAELLRTHFANTFDKGTNAHVLKAASLMEMVIANTSRLDDLSKPMREALAVGFAGLMTHTATRDNLLNLAYENSGTGQSDLEDARVSWVNPSIDIDGIRLRKFLQCLADEPKAVKTIAAAFGPTIAAVARAAKGLPVGGTFPDAIGFIYGSMLRKFDADVDAKRAFYDGLGMGLTVVFATAGGLAGGPATAMTAGALGSGILQNITSLVDLAPKTNTGLPLSDGAIRQYFASAYIMSSYQWLDPKTQKNVKDSLALKVKTGGVQPVLEFVDGMMQITNVSKMSPAELKRVIGLIVAGTKATPLGSKSKDNDAIDFFFNRVSESTEHTRDILP